HRWLRVQRPMPCSSPCHRCCLALEPQNQRNTTERTGFRLQTGKRTLRLLRVITETRRQRLSATVQRAYMHPWHAECGCCDKWYLGCESSSKKALLQRKRTWPTYYMHYRHYALSDRG